MEDFRVSVAILHKGVSSGKTFIKCRDLTCDVGSTTIRKLKGIEHEIGSQISFANFVFRCQDFYTPVVGKTKNEKNFSTCYRDAKESTNPGRKFSEFLRTFIELSGFKVHFATNAQKYQLWLR